MNQLVLQYYQGKKKEEPSFYATEFLAESESSWEDIKNKAKDIPRGWVELCRLSLEDRILFMRDFWLDRLPYHPKFHDFLLNFFAKLDDLGVVLSQYKEGDSWVAEMVYSVKDDTTFFRGLPPCLEEGIEELKSILVVSLPRDYLSFLRIHNGFGKLSELELVKSEYISDLKRHIENQLLQREEPVLLNDRIVDPMALIPFYESYGLSSYQCFFADWYPGNEMGNVYFSGIDYTISDYTDKKEWLDQLAFPTFLDWFAFYLEGHSGLYRT